MDFAASSEGILMLRGCAAAGTVFSAAITMPQASRYLRFDAIIPLRHFSGLLREGSADHMRKDSNPNAQDPYFLTCRGRSARQTYLPFSDPGPGVQADGDGL